MDISEGYQLIVFSSGGEDLFAEEDEAKDNVDSAVVFLPWNLIFHQVLAIVENLTNEIHIVLLVHILYTSKSVNWAEVLIFVSEITILQTGAPLLTFQNLSTSTIPESCPDGPLGATAVALQDKFWPSSSQLAPQPWSM